jgi:hypothetical protein
MLFHLYCICATVLVQCFYSVVTVLVQCCHSVVTPGLSQCCYGVVIVLLLGALENGAVQRQHAPLHIHLWSQEVHCCCCVVTLLVHREVVTIVDNPGMIRINAIVLYGLGHVEN